MMMKRVIKDYTSVTKTHLELIANEFPNGFEIEDLQTFKKQDGTSFRGLEVRTEEVIYLFKITSKLLEVIDDHTDDSFGLDSFSDSDDYEFDNS